MPARANRPAKVGQNRRPILGKDVFHRIDGHRRIEVTVERELLQADQMEGDSDVSRPRLRQHPGRLVDPGDPPASGGDEAEVLTGSTRGVKDDSSGGHVATRRSTNRRWVSTGYGSSS